MTVRIKKIGNEFNTYRRFKFILEIWIRKKGWGKKVFFSQIFISRCIENQICNESPEYKVKEAKALFLI